MGRSQPQEGAPLASKTTVREPSNVGTGIIPSVDSILPVVSLLVPEVGLPLSAALQATKNLSSVDILKDSIDDSSTSQDRSYLNKNSAKSGSSTYISQDLLPPEEDVPCALTGKEKQFEMFPHLSSPMTSSDAALRRQKASLKVNRLVTSKPVFSASVHIIKQFLLLKNRLFEEYCNDSEDGTLPCTKGEIKTIISQKKLLNSLTFQINSIIDDINTTVSNNLPRKKMVELNKISSTIRSVHTKDGYINTFGEFEMALKKDIIDSFADFPTSVMRKATLIFVRSLVKGWLSDSNMKALRHFDGKFTSNVNQPISRPKFEPDHLSDAHLKKISRSDTKEGTLAKKTLVVRTGAFKASMPKKGEKGRKEAEKAKAHRKQRLYRDTQMQGLTEWFFQKVFPHQKRDFLDNLTSTQDLFKWMKENMYYDFNTYEKEVFTNLYDDDTILAALKKYAKDSRMYIIFLNAKMYGEERFALVDKAYVKIKNNITTAFKEPSLLKTIYDKLCSFMSSMGEGVAILLDYLKKAYAKVMEYITLVWEKVVWFGKALVQIFYQFICCLASKLGLQLPEVQLFPKLGPDDSYIDVLLTPVGNVFESGTVYEDSTPSISYNSIGNPFTEGATSSNGTYNLPPEDARKFKYESTTHQDLDPNSSDDDDDWDTRWERARKSYIQREFQHKFRFPTDDWSSDAYERAVQSFFEPDSWSSGDDDSYLHSEEQGLNTFASTVSRFFSAISGPFSKIITDGLDEKSFIFELKSATSVFGFFNSGMALITRILNIVSSLFSYIGSKFTGAEKHHLLIEEADNFLLAIQTAENIPLETATAYIELRTRLHQANKLFPSTDPMHGVYGRTRTAFERHFSTMKQILNSSKKRVQPLAIHIVGAAGLGKTTIVPLLCSLITGKTMRATAADSYNWESTGFQDGYCGQKNIIINDIFNEQDPQRDITMCSDLLHIISNDYYPVPMADPSKKGLHPLQAEIVITTSNAVTFVADKALRDADAYKRRRTVVVEMLRVPGANLLARPEHAYNDYIFVVKNVFKESDPNLWQSMDFYTFVRYCKIIDRDVIRKDHVVFADGNKDNMDFETAMTGICKDPTTTVDSAILDVFWRSRQPYHDSVRNDQIRSSAEAQALGEEIINAEHAREHKTTVRSASDQLALGEKLRHCILRDAFYGAIAEGESIEVFTLPHFNLFVPEPTAWESLCYNLSKHRKTLAVAAAAIASGVAVLATLLMMKKVPFIRFEDTVMQNASGLTTVHAARKVIQIRQYAHSKEQDSSEYYQKISRAICPITFVLKSGHEGYAQGIFLNNVYFITNKHSIEKIVDKIANDELATWYITRHDGTKVYMDNIKLDEDVSYFTEPIGFEHIATDLAFIRIPQDVRQFTNSQRSILKHFPKDSSVIRMGVWSFATWRKKASKEYVSGYLEAVKNAVRADIKSETGNRYHDIIRTNVASSPGCCGSLLLGGNNHQICGMHIAGTDVHADFMPLTFELLREVIRGAFDPTFCEISTIQAQTLPLPAKESAELESQHQGLDIVVMEYDQKLVFPMEGQALPEAPFLIMPALQPQPQHAWPRIIIPVEEETPSQSLSPKLETILAVLAVMFWMPLFLIAFMSSRDLTYVISLILTPLSTELKEKSLHLSSILQEAVDFLTVSGHLILEVITSHEPLMVPYSLNKRLQTSWLNMKSRDYLTLMSRIVSRMKELHLKNQHSLKRKFSQSYLFLCLFMCGSFQYHCCSTFASAVCNLVLPLVSTPTAEILTCLQVIFSVWMTLFYLMVTTRVSNMLSPMSLLNTLSYGWLNSSPRD